MAGKAGTFSFNWLKRKLGACCQSAALHLKGAPGLEAETRNTLLKNLVLAQYPRIGEENTPDFERVNLIRQWAARTTSWSNREGLLDRPGTTNSYTGGFNFYSQDAPTIYAAFMADRGGVWCQGAAYALSKLYTLFGYKAFRVGIGVPNTEASHNFTLVAIEHGGKEKKILSVQDAYFDISYTHTDGRPMDYFELLELLKARRDGDITVADSSPPLQRKLLYFENELVRKVDGLYSLADFQEQFRTELNSFYEEGGFPLNILYLHLSVLSAFDLPKAERNEFISKLSAEHVWKG